MMVKSDDLVYMRRAIALAERGSGWVNPNPLVGAIVVKDGRVVGEGHHDHFGGAHAEVNAIRNAGEDTRGSTLYVTLEPCNHHGKTPPCTALIAEKGIARVVIGMTDPNPLVNGAGINFLVQHGIEVVSGVLEEQVQKQNEVFIKFITTGLPFVVMKTAMTLDGKIATVTNASRWITGDASRRLVHRMRQRYSAVMVGVDTLHYDDPLLNIRLRKLPSQPAGWKDPLKVIADSTARIPLTAKVLTNNPQLTIVAVTERAEKSKVLNIRRTGAEVIVCRAHEGKVDLNHLMQLLGTIDIDSVMIEGGSTLAFSAFQAGIVDKVVTFIAPKILGGAKAPSAVAGAGIKRMDNAIKLSGLTHRSLGEDILIEARVERRD